MVLGAASSQKASLAGFPPVPLLANFCCSRTRQIEWRSPKAACEGNTAGRAHGPAPPPSRQLPCAFAGAQPRPPRAASHTSTGLHRKARPVQANDGSFPHHSGSSRKGSARAGLRQGLLLISSCFYSPWSLGVTVTSGRFTSFHTVPSLKLSDTRISGEVSPSALLQNCSPNSGLMPSSAWISRAQVHPAARNPWTGFILSLSPRVRLCSLGHLYQH